MVRNKQDVMDLFFPSDSKDRYEYVLQRIKKVLADGTQVLKVVDIRPGPEPTNIDEFPSTDVVIRILGVPYEHPVTHVPFISRQKTKDHFEGRTMQRNFLVWLGRLVAASMPTDERLAGLRNKLRDVTTGRPSNLPARLDLVLLYRELVQQIRIARKWLREHGNCSTDALRAEFVKAFSGGRDFWWVRLFGDDQIEVESITKGSPEGAAKMILALELEVSEEAIHSRLSRRE